MKKFALIMILFLAGCNHSYQTSQNTHMIRPGSGTADRLTLTEEDILALQTQQPTILLRITKCEQIKLDDIIYMQVLGISPSTIIKIIEYTKSNFALTTSDIVRLQAEGVPFKVINYMMRS